MPREHTIKQGECIFSIATGYGHKWETLQGQVVLDDRTELVIRDFVRSHTR